MIILAVVILKSLRFEVYDNMSDPDTTKMGNLPSWMSSRQNDRTKRPNTGSPHDSDEGEKRKQTKGGGQSSASTSASPKLSKLLVLYVIYLLEISVFDPF